MACFRYLVSGTVQGVGFRAYVQRQAQALGLSGWVRNCTDGTVEVEACGTDRQLRDLALVLERGPRGARVTGVKTFGVPEVGGPLVFTIRPDGE